MSPSEEGGAIRYFRGEDPKMRSGYHIRVNSDRLRARHQTHMCGMSWYSVSVRHAELRNYAKWTVQMRVSHFFEAPQMGKPLVATLGDAK